MRDYFYALADHLAALTRRDEVALCSFQGEESDFVRFNRGKVRQAGRVTQRECALDLVQGRRHATATLTLSGDATTDRARLADGLDELRALCRHVPEDPHLLYARERCDSEDAPPSRLPDSAAMVEQVVAAAAGRDLVGVFASGAMHAGFANSLGQRNWHSRHSFHLDWSLHAGSQAVKASYAGFEWDAEQLDRAMAQAAAQLTAMARPPLVLPPGDYRAYLAPAAMEEIIGLLCWGGFGARAQRTKTTPLLRMIEQGATLHPAVSLTEHTAAGLAPAFQGAGFVRPARVSLIEQGRYRDCLVSPRSAVEYGLVPNGATDHEVPESLEMAHGDLPEARVLEALGRGLYLGNLWYLNYSDRNVARMTGMSRFATFWVEDGELQAPVVPLRFDDSIYRLLGDGLDALTAERRLLFDPSTYGARSQRSAHLPGALVRGMTFTL